MIFQLDELNLVNGGIPYVKDGKWSLLQPGTATSLLAASSSGHDASSLAWQNPITPTQLGAGAVLTMPSKIYAVVGHECNVYLDNVIRTYARGTYVATPINLYEFTVTCANGIQQEERWTYTPTSGQTGSIPWSVTVALNGQVLGTASSTLVTSAAKATGTPSRKLLVIGDSTSDIGSTWIPELVNLCNYNCTAPTLGGGADNLTITPIGTHSNTSADSGDKPDMARRRIFRRHNSMAHGDTAAKHQSLCFQRRVQLRHIPDPQLAHDVFQRLGHPQPRDQ